MTRTTGKSADRFDIHLYPTAEHPKQQAFIRSKAKRKIARAGRRGGKTTAVAILAVEAFLQKRRVLYGAPTTEQCAKFWKLVKNFLAEPISRGIYYKNESLHLVELPGSEQRIRAKTCWSPDMLRGDTCDLLILDEWQGIDEDTWETVGAGMLIDNHGDAVFIYTPPSLHSRSVSKARDPRHAAKMYAKALADTTGLWAAFHWTSLDNPFVSKAGLARVTLDMSALAYRQEIEAEDIDEVPGALWSRKVVEECRLAKVPDEVRITRVVIAIDPSGTSKDTSDEAGIMEGGLGSDGHGYLFRDLSKRDTPRGWATTAVSAYHDSKADRIVAEVNFGGDMVEETIRTVDPNVSYRAVSASRGKLVRAEPISALCEKRFIHFIGDFPELEDELCSYVAGNKSPNRLDAFVWLMTELVLGGGVLGLVEYMKREQAKIDSAKELAKPVIGQETPKCPRPECVGAIIQRISTGFRCARCGWQWNPKVGEIPKSFSRTDALRK